MSKCFLIIELIHHFAKETDQMATLPISNDTSNYKTSLLLVILNLIACKIIKLNTPTAVLSLKLLLVILVYPST